MRTLSRQQKQKQRQQGSGCNSFVTHSQRGAVEACYSHVSEGSVLELFLPFALGAWGLSRGSTGRGNRRLPVGGRGGYKGIYKRAMCRKCQCNANVRMGCEDNVNDHRRRCADHFAHVTECSTDEKNPQ